MIEAGDLWNGKLREGEVHGDAFVELTKIVLEWKRPEPPWPEGTTFTEPFRARRSTPMSTWAITPAGARYELMVEHLRADEPDPRERPPIIWGIWVDRYGAVFAVPRVAQLSVTIDPPHTDERLRDAYAGVPLGLAREYRIGQLSRALREETRVVSEGWGYK